MTTALRVLFVEDHKPLLANLAEYFLEPQYQADFASDGLTALHLLATEAYDVIVLDVNLPGVSGVTLCQHLRQYLQNITPVLFLTALDSLEDKTLGFQAGGDDYLTKPFDLRELALRIQALARRQQRHLDRITLGELHYLPGQLLVQWRDKSCVLSGIPAALFELLIRSAPSYVGYHRFSESVWHNDFTDENTIRTHIYSLRKQLDQHITPGLIKSVHGLGYSLDIKP
jgi:DNA-binding response OmpR family regulator